MTEVSFGSSDSMHHAAGSEPDELKFNKTPFKIVQFYQIYLKL